MVFSIIYTIRDEKAVESTTSVNLPESTAFTDVALFAAELAKIIDPIITGAIIRIGVAFQVTLPGGLASTPAANTDVEEGARFQWRTVNNYMASNRLPTFDEQFIQAGTREVDQTDANVAAFVNAILTGINLTGVGGSGTIQPSDYRGEDITAIDTAREMFQSSRK